MERHLQFLDQLDGKRVCEDPLDLRRSSAKLHEAEPDRKSNSLEVSCELSNERVASGAWCGNTVFVYTTTNTKEIRSFVAGNLGVMAYTDRMLHVLGYVAAHKKVYCIDTEHEIVSFELDLTYGEMKSRLPKSMEDLGSQSSNADSPGYIPSPFERVVMQHSSYLCNYVSLPGFLTALDE
ncbi:Coatomer subunit beta', partial [Perkinsus olseni]